MIIFFGFKTILYAADPEKLKAFYKSYHECQKELNLSACEYYIYRSNIYALIVNIYYFVETLVKIFIIFEKRKDEKRSI
jgi:hypothetical protein